MGEWNSATFGELVEDGVLEIGDGYRAKLDELGGNGPLFLRAGNLTEHGIEWDGLDRFHVDVIPKLQSKLGQPGDTMVTTKGNSVGRTGYVQPSAPEFVYSPHLSYWRSRNPSQLSSGYLRYWPQTQEFVSQLRAMAFSTDMAPYLSLVDQRRLRITLPPFSVQDAIAALLGALDDKIAVNDKTARAATELAMTYGRQATNRLDGEETSLANHAEIVKGASYRSADLTEGGGWLVTLKCVGRDGSFQAAGMKPYSGECKSNQVVEDGDIVVAQTDLTQKAEVIGRPVRVANGGRLGRLVASLDLAIVRPRDPFSREFLFALLSSQDFRDHAMSYCNGTTVLHMGARALPDFRFVLPDSVTVKNTTAIMSPLLAWADQVKAENRTLAELRDTLLPKLMSGELRVRGAEKVVEEAT